MSLIEDLVAAYRILAAFRIIDAYGHVSVRSENDPNRYLLARSLAPELVTPDDIMEYDLDSTPMTTRGASRCASASSTARSYKARPDVMAVVHNHSPTVIPFSVTRRADAADLPHGGVRRPWACRTTRFATSSRARTCW